MTAKHIEAKLSPGIRPVEADERLLELSVKKGSQAKEQQRACFFWEFPRSCEIIVGLLELRRNLEALRAARRFNQSVLCQRAKAWSNGKRLRADYPVFTGEERQIYAAVWDMVAPLKQFIGWHAVDTLESLEHNDKGSDRIARSFPRLSWFECAEHVAIDSGEVSVAARWASALKTTFDPQLRIATVPFIIRKEELTKCGAGCYQYVPDSAAFPPLAAGGVWEHRLISYPSFQGRSEKIMAYGAALDGLAACTSVPDPRRACPRTATGAPLNINFGAALSDLFAFRAFHSAGTWDSFRRRYGTTFCRITGARGLPDHDTLVDKIWRAESILGWFRCGRVIPLTRRPPAAR